MIALYVGSLYEEISLEPTDPESSTSGHTGSQPSFSMDNMSCYLAVPVSSHSFFKQAYMAPSHITSAFCSSLPAPAPQSPHLM
jgi:hypothetical protein